MNHILRFAAVVALSLAVLNAADAPTAQPVIGTLPVGKVLFLGNSITLHGPAPQIGWTGNWGMAASAKELDYVHLLTAQITKAAGAKPQTMVRNIADFERQHLGFNIAKEFKAELEFQPDLVIVAIGENVPELGTDEAIANYATSYRRLLDEFRKAGQASLFVRSSFWPNTVKDDIMRKACADVGGTFVDISELGRDPSNAAKAERKIEHEGVAGHPGDKGMRAIADAIFAAIQQRVKNVSRN